MIRRLVALYRNHYAGCPIRPSRLERLRRRLSYWLHDNCLGVALVLYLVAVALGVGR